MQKLALAAAALLFSIGAAAAQTTPPPATTTTPPAKESKAKAKTPAKPRSAESLECSKQADAQNLHGKPRKTFRAKCMKDMKKKT